ncbi:DUF4870 family protein [Salinarimonas ramus]|uniref:Membrane protein n=1 Tax=Salinarimonas ramus TaxID=690164 RepID=A0A917QF27_9HYPH|nr:DUF4870 domain-containing protein [Salinarimonas ramus]GGK45828.1 membrane protein [Salinarimonas ramus]
MQTQAVNGGGAGPAVKDKTLGLIVYGLYLVGFFTGVSALIGVIIAHVRRAEADPVTATHLDYQIRTFWIGLAMLLVGALLSLVLIGWFVLLFWAVWTIVRCVKGGLRLNDGLPIQDPRALLW